MRQHNCPICGAPLEWRRMTWLGRTCVGVPFRCQTCATMLHWSRKHPRGLWVLVALMFPVAAYGLSGLPELGRSVVIAPVLVALALPFYWVILFAPKTLAKHSDE